MSKKTFCHSKKIKNPEQAVINTLEVFDLLDSVKRNPDQIKELKKIAPRLEDFLFPKIGNEKREVQMALL